MKKVVKKRAKRFDDGGSTSPLRGNFSTARGSDEGVDIYSAARKRDEDRAKQEAFEAKIQELDNAPEDYVPKVTLRGRPDYSDQYTTAPSPKAASKAPAKTKGAGAGRGSYAGYKASGDVASAARREFAKNTQNEALEDVHPEMMLTPGTGIKSIAQMARNLASGKGAAQAAERIEPYFEKAAPYLQELPNRATKLLEGYRPNFTMMKKGGTVKKMASGGSTSKVSSASKRGDGIASRGKTRGKFC